MNIGYYFDDIEESYFGDLSNLGTERAARNELNRLDKEYKERKLQKQLDKSYNQALEDFEAYAQKWADRQECIGRSVVKLVVKELIDSAKELKK